jgi:hypothetical protein
VTQLTNAVSPDEPERPAFPLGVQTFQSLRERGNDSSARIKYVPLRKLSVSQGTQMPWDSYDAGRYVLTDADVSKYLSDV